MTQQNRIITAVSGTAVPIHGDDIDTDRVIPARFMKEVTFDHMGEYLFFDARFNENGTPKDFPLNDSKYDNAAIMVIVGKNFGCGSSREHAPQAIMRYGFKAIIAESYAEIFSGNCKSLGIPAVSAKPEDLETIAGLIEANPSVVVTLDLNAEHIKVGDQKFSLTLPADRKKAFLTGEWDSNAQLAANLNLIRQTADQLPYLKFN